VTLRVFPVVCWLLALSVAGCSEDAPLSAGSTGQETTTSSTATPAVTTPKLPSPISTENSLIVPLTKLETARIDMNSPDWLAVAAGSLWVRLDSGNVVRVDPANATAEEEVPASGDEQFNICQAFGASEDSIFSCSPFGPLERISASTSRVTDELPIKMSRYQGHLVVASGRLWIISEAGDSMSGLNLEDNTLGEPIPFGSACADLAAEGSIVWAVCPWDNQVLRIDTSTSEVTGRLALREPWQVDVHDDVWIGFKGGVAQVDPETLSVDAVYDVQPDSGGAILADGRRTWVRCAGGPFLVELDPVAQKVISTVTADDLRSGGNLAAIDGQLWATAYNDAALVRLRPPK